RRRHTSFSRDWSSDVCSSDLNRLIIPISFLLILFFSFPLDSLAQSNRFTITGKVVDDELGAPLEYATVSITKPNDPNFIDGVVRSEERRVGTEGRARQST